MYDLTPLFWYRIQFMAELLLAEALFATQLNARPHFVPRLIGAILFCFGAAFAFPIAAFDALYCSFMFICLFGVTLLAMKFLFVESWLNVIYCAIAGYTTQHLAYELNDLAVVLFGLNDGAPLDAYGSGAFSFQSNPFVWLLMLWVYGMTYWVIYIFCASKIRKWDILNLKSHSLLLLASLIVFVDIVFSAIVTYSLDKIMSTTILVMLYIYNIFCCCLTLYVQFQLVIRKKYEKEANTLEQLLYQEKENYAISKENIELINLKCHDLRHQIRTIGATQSISSDVVREIERVVSVYDSVVDTSNEALNVILTEKSLLCNRNGIRLSCIADGARLSFMTDSDIYSLFGNMLDNAIEAASKLSGDERFIGLCVKAVNSFLSVNIHNYYRGEIKFEGKLPVTTKSSKEYHGYGMKSIFLICEKYGGECSVTAKDGVFTLNIVFPLAD